MAPKNAKSNLSIRLTESVVFLRGSIESTVFGRRQHTETQPAMLRGLLSLTLHKPTKISSIEIDLEGKTRTSWPEGIGARRIEVTEEHKILSASTVFFHASTSDQSLPRRTVSVGPGLDVDEDEHDENSSGHEELAGQHPPRLAQASRRLSADHSTWQRDAVSHSSVPPSFDEAASPPYTPMLPGIPRMNSSASSSSGKTVEDSNLDPGHQLEEFRNALRSELDTERLSPRSPPSAKDTSGTYSSSSSIHDFRESPLSRRQSLEDRPGDEHEYTPDTSPYLTPIVSRVQADSLSRRNSATATPATPTFPATSDESGTRGRRSARFSLAAVSNVLLDAVKDRVRSSSPRIRVANGKVQSRDQSMERSVDRSQDRDGSRGRTRNKAAEKEKVKDKLNFGKRLSEAIGHADEVTSGDGWKEFRKGTYTYPISFAIPSNSPPTLHCDYGSVTYRLKATVHRPGTFTSKLTATRDVTLIASPGEDDLDESDNITVQRSWESQMHYVIIISGKAFPIGGAIPLHLTFVPTAAIKIYRISAVLEERVDYYTQFKRIARSDLTRRFELFSLKYPEKDAPPILPLESDYESSPLRGMIEVDSPAEKEAEDAAAMSAAGPGPWTLQHDLQLPTSCGRVHFTNKHRKSNIGINHVLKIIMRVERGDDEYVDPKTGKKKLFDIVVQTPIHILSCRCNPEWTALPRYSSFATETHAKTQSCMCDIKRRGATISVDDILPLTAPYPDARRIPVHTTDAYDDERNSRHKSGFPPAMSHGNAGSGSGPRDHHAPGQAQDWLHIQSPPSLPRSYTNGSITEDGETLVRTPSLALSDAESLYNRNTQFARLVAGQESELGEEPPRYDYVANEVSS